MNLTNLGARDLRDALARGEVRCIDAADAFIARTETATALNAYVAFDADGLRRQAIEADARLAQGQRLALLGVPIALKDNIQAAGLPCGDGTGALHGRIARRDAEIVRRLRAAGALISGKLGMHELALGITNHNAVTGAVRNPWDASRIPGGSSGGCGAAVAARLVPAAIGTDTGGSVRIPAALCGVAGFRPSVGRVSADGVAPISATRDTPGPLARSVADLALLDEVLSGDAAPLPAMSLRGLRLGLPQHTFWDDLEPGVRRATDAALDALRAAGATLVPVPLPDAARLAGDAGFAIVLHEFVRDMTRYLHAEQPGVTLDRLLVGVRSRDVAAIVSGLTGDGTIPEPLYRQALQARRQLQACYAEAFAAHDVAALVFPTTPRTAALIGEDDTVLLEGRAVPTFATFIRNTDPGSLAALPGLSLPIGLAHDRTDDRGDGLGHGLPVGLALDGPAGSDKRLLAIGAAIEAVLPPMPAPPQR